MPPHSTTSLSSHSPTTTTTTFPPRIQIPLPPKSTTSSTNTTTSTYPPLPTALRSAINAHLLSTSAINTIQSVLTHHLQRSGWTDNVRLLVLDLLRSGECKTFGECMGVVIREARGDLTGEAGGKGKDGVGAGAGTNGKEGNADGNGVGKYEGGGRVDGGKDGSKGEGNEGEARGEDGVDGVGEDAEKARRKAGRRVNVDVRIPERVVDEGVQVVREALEEIVEVVDG